MQDEKTPPPLESHGRKLEQVSCLARHSGNNEMDNYSHWQRCGGMGTGTPHYPDPDTCRVVSFREQRALPSFIEMGESPLPFQSIQRSHTRPRRPCTRAASETWTQGSSNVSRDAKISNKRQKVGMFVFTAKQCRPVSNKNSIFLIRLFCY